MNKKLLLLLILSILININKSQAIKGRITDKSGNPVPSATIVFTNTKDQTNYYQTVTDANGFYNLDLPLYTIQNSDKQYTFFDIYPNPFYSGTIIPFFLNKTGKCYIYIYNSIGQKIKTISEGTLTAGLHQLVWDGTTDKNQRVSPGFFIAYMYFEGRTTSQKIIMRTNNNTAVFPDGIPFIPVLDTARIISYNIKITSSQTLPFSVGNYTIKDINKVDFVVFKKLAIPFKVSGSYLSINKGDNTYDTIFVNGINLGIGIPGTNPGDLAATASDYRRWFKEMADVGFNVIRVYTMHYPRFYDELAKYNNENPDKPLYLLHGAWLDEEKPQGNFYNFTNTYLSDIYEVVDCMHGNKTLPERPGRASGVYSTNITPWLLGYIIGREVHPEEVLKTNEINPNSNSYYGLNLSMPESTDPENPTTAFECWVTQCLDYLIGYERQKYQVERPVSFSSWPTLDPFTYLSEKLFNSLEDTAKLDLSKIVKVNAPAGFFISYHAYPYYPDFMTDEEGFLYYSDPYGKNNYLPYLYQLYQKYTQTYGLPVIIAEYGVPSSWGNAHYATSGMNHGGHDYEKQGFYNARMLENMADSARLAGGCLFSWIDEWFKQTWIVNPMTCSSERRLMWHNLASPEENFGLITFVPDTIIYQDYPELLSIGNDIKKTSVAVDFQYFHIKIEVNDSITDNDTLIVAFDTYDDDLGEQYLPDGRMLNKRSEFFLNVNKDSANLFVTRAYNTYGIYFIKKWWPDTLTDQLFHSILSNKAPWDLVTWKNSIKDTASIQYIGRLHSRDSLDVSSSLDAVVRNKCSYDIRIPWQLLNFIDPSQSEVLADYRITKDTIEVRKTDGIAIDIRYRQTMLTTQRKSWESWGYVNQNTGEYIFPKYREVRKKSYDVFKERIKLLNLKPKI